jgi:hypothetical protein
MVVQFFCKTHPFHHQKQRISDVFEGKGVRFFFFLKLFLFFKQVLLDFHRIFLFTTRLHKE